MEVVAHIFSKCETLAHFSWFTSARGTHERGCCVARCHGVCGARLPFPGAGKTRSGSSNHEGRQLCTLGKRSLTGLKKTPAVVGGTAKGLDGPLRRANSSHGGHASVFHLFWLQRGLGSPRQRLPPSGEKLTSLFE